MNKLNNILKKKYLLHYIALSITIITCSVLYFATLSYEVSIDGKNVGIVERKKDVYELIEKKKMDIYKEFKKDVKIDQEIVFTKCRVGKDKITSPEEFNQNLNEVIDLTIRACAINIKGKDVVYVKDKKHAENILKTIKNQHKEGIKGIKDIRFVEKVDLVEKDIKISKLKNEDSAYEYLLTGTDDVQKYIVKDGDNLWNISRKYNLSMDDIEKANPGIDIEKLDIDQEINITVPKSYLNVKVTSVASYDEKIPYDIVYEETASLYKGDKKVKSEGKEGFRKVVAEVTRINGKIDSKNILKEEIVEDAEDKIVLKGTKKKPTYIASGAFSNPTRGKLSSKFGRRWGRKHTGIDIAAPKGTPIKASDGGTVVFSGTQNGYGKLIIIDHKNGYKTYYGHCSSLVAKKGQKVAKGDVVAKVGSTGRSTGNHLHFEVRKNNVPLNPSKYVKY
ncbi:MAG: peptidoglycan DD-metalloendopeptidase family protein [Tepidibacter sp.]|jgi:murein DD-endopeptidase MepM/ murein hydrolase activator NlpD|uniref:LysM peptidoglycan-binding domain-containing M23 family metallopeptidase n=1 Tax=Tepidibacter sp. TaxID=2529387 RepID=UPI0025E29A7D|nr:M23 family metallopeptidase [Tepidibacter sp.]MCT4508217.1 peptidoglycan DD-metalloendopeptidase family protein [Tepidibacter sp.]